MHADMHKSYKLSYRYVDRGFITFVGFTVSWELRVKGNLNARTNTGLINTSPQTSMLPFVRLQFGCDNTIRIPGTAILNN